MATILIVDDLSSNRDVLTVLLKGGGHRLIEAKDGAAALAIAIAEPLDLVITDILMPVMDGYELVTQLRANPATANIPVLFYSAYYGELEARELALSMGVAEVITKPIDPVVVLRIVDEILAGTSHAAISAAPIGAGRYREHLRLLTDRLSVTAEDLRLANAKLRGLVNIGLELASTKDSDTLLQMVCSSARDLLGARYATLGFVRGDERNIVRMMICGAEPASWVETSVAPGALVNSVINGRRVVRGMNESGDPERLGLPHGHPPIYSYLAAPIASPTHVYGWVCLGGEESASFAESDEPLAMALFCQVGRAYENIQFYLDAVKHAAALEQEVSERKQAEGVASFERNKAQSYLDTADVMLVALDSNHRITLVNRKACDLLGWSEQELLGRDWIETCLPPRLRAPLNARFESLLEGDASIVENAVLQRGGGERMIEWHNRVLRGDHGQVVGSLSSGADITEQREATIALRVAEERMRFALESAGVGIWDMDYLTGALTWSETMEAQYGVARGTFDGKFESFIERVHPMDRESLQATIGNAMRLGKDFVVQNRVLHPGGAVRYMRGAGRIVLGADGKPVRGIGISIDITDSRRLEEQFQQAQKMEAVGRLASGVAHDFNNLLTAILGYCELLLVDMGSADPRRADIGEIQKAGMSAAGLTRQLLAFSRQQVIEPMLVDINDVIKHLRGLLGRLIGADIEVILSPASDLALIKADRGQLEQILMNLAVNARDAMPTGGTLRIETGNVDLDEEYAATHLAAAAGHYVGLTISDTGSGMSAEVKDRLFEPFFTTKGPGKGTGLGLSTVHGIVAASGGTIEVYSEVGNGTTFKVYFPRVDGDVDVLPVVVAGTLPSPTGHTILVVEDVAGLRDLTKRLLERLGYRVMVAANADEATKLFERHPEIDVLLTDVVMPGAGGPELTDRLLNSRPTLKVIYMSGYTEAAILHRGVLKAGISFLHKPFTSEALGKKVRGVLGFSG